MKRSDWGSEAKSRQSTTRRVELKNDYHGMEPNERYFT